MYWDYLSRRYNKCIVICVQWLSQFCVNVDIEIRIRISLLITLQWRYSMILSKNLQNFISNLNSLRLYAPREVTRNKLNLNLNSFKLRRFLIFHYNPVMRMSSLLLICIGIFLLTKIHMMTFISVKVYSVYHSSVSMSRSLKCTIIRSPV